MKKIILPTALLLAGLFVGYQLPRGPALFAWIGSLGSNQSSYHSLEASGEFDQLLELMQVTKNNVLNEAESEQEAIEGLRWILRVLSMSTEVAADGDPRLPYFQRMDTPARKVGGDNPDGEYDLAVIDGKFDYRITGNLGTVRYLSFTISGGQGMTPRYMAGYIGDDDLQADADGNFTLWLTRERPSAPGAWIPLPEDASSILVRQYIADRQKETLASYQIEAIGDSLPALSPPTHGEIAMGIRATAYAFLKLSTLHKTVLPEMLDAPNQFFEATSKNLGGEISGTENLYMLMHFNIAEDEALVVDVKPPASRYWNLTMESIWHETPDYLNRPVSRTLENVTPGPDGRVRFILAHEDPGLPNWIDTISHHRGFLTFRWLEVEDTEVPKVTKIKFSELERL
jgi:hypothetical protein